MKLENCFIKDGENRDVFFEIHWVLKYILDTNSLGLKLDPKGSKKES